MFFRDERCPSGTRMDVFDLFPNSGESDGVAWLSTPFLQNVHRRLYRAKLPEEFRNELKYLQHKLLKYFGIRKKG